MKPRDFILVIALLILTIICYLGLNFNASKMGGKVVIKVDKEIFGEYDIDIDRVIQIKDGNTCEIKGGEVFMTHANCPDHYCINQGRIRLSHQSIICLPNKVIIEIIGLGENDMDA